MSVDTVDKRRSAIGQGLLFLTIRHVPDGTISAADRRHSSGYYSGIDTTVDTYRFWRENTDSSESFAKVSGSSWSTAAQYGSGEIWVQSKEVDD